MHAIEIGITAVHTSGKPKPDFSRFGCVLAAGGAAVVVLRLALAVHRGELARLDAARSTSPRDLFISIPVIGVRH